MAHYVVSVDVERNVVRVSSRREDAARISVGLSNEHWTTEAPVLPIAVQAQARYREQPFNATITKKDEDLVATFDEPHITAPGQSLVLYDGDRCLGGAIINK
jgi:tRNA-uridine 2-sulfurtransferase